MFNGNLNVVFGCLVGLDYGEDIVLLSHRHADMQAKTTTLSEEAWSIGLKVSRKKTKHISSQGQIQPAVCSQLKYKVCIDSMVIPHFRGYLPY